MPITPDLLKILRDDINAALAAVATKHQLATLEAGAATYSADSFTFKLNGLVAGGKTEEEKAYEYLLQYQPEPKLPPLHTVIMINDKPFTVVGKKARGEKIMVNDSDGKGYLASQQSVANAYAKIIKKAP